MRLILRYHDVCGVTWGDRDELRDGCLYVDEEALRAEILLDPRVADLEVQLVDANSSCRIMSVFDVVQPRRKEEPAGTDYPGALTAIRSSGEGATRVLRNVALTVAAPAAGRRVLSFKPPHLAGRPAEPFDRYAGLHHVVILPRPADGVAGDAWRDALRLASLRASVHLAKSAVGPTDAEEVLDLRPAAADLPRVAYVYQLHSHQSPTVPGEPVLYGDNVRYLLPTILHPNEVIDGGLLPSYSGSIASTYAVQNNDIVRGLYALHGTAINFVGVVAYVANQLPEERDRATVLASNLVRHTLHADGAVFTKSGGGAPNVDMALIADRCEQLGVKTVLMLWETADEGAVEDSSLFNSASLDAIVSLGSSHFDMTFDPVDRAIGSSEASATEILVATSNQVLGPIDQLGGSRFTVTRH